MLEHLVDMARSLQTTVNAARIAATQIMDKIRNVRMPCFSCPGISAATTSRRITEETFPTVKYLAGENLVLPRERGRTKEGEKISPGRPPDTL
jgi:hypothetical protein